MAGERSYVRVPPDSTGKKIRHEPFHRVGYNNRIGNHFWQVGKTYEIGGYSGTVFNGPNSNSGYIGFKMNSSSDFQNVDLTAGMAIVYNNVTVATVTSDELIHIPYTQISGGENPNHTVNVDATGAMNVRFGEGRAQLDAFGKLRVSGASILGDYTFSSNYLPDQFATIIDGKAHGASIGHNDFLHCAVVSTGVTGQTHTATANFGRNAVRAQMTSHTYHHYFPGLSQQAIMTVALSDEGKMGVMREWGYFDGEYDSDITNPSATNELVEGNGYFFRVEGTNGLEFVIRSFATGVVTERIMRRNETIIKSGGVVQSTTAEGWNGDPLDGTGDSGKVFSLLDDNIYWLDVQWLGAGRVRFGTYHQGQRITIHEYYHDNNGGVPTSQTGSLPLRFCQHHMKDMAVTGSASMNIWCAAVFTEADIDTSVLGAGRTEYFKAVIDPRNMNDVQGLNDTTMLDRKITTKTGITSSGTTLTVPNLTGIKPGWIVKVASGGTGVMQEETRVSDIINSTTIQVDKAPSTPIISSDNVTFEMPVSDEYYLIGILAPQPRLKGINHTNRTLHLPRSVRAYAYWENGDPVQMSIQVYVNPVISGHNRVINLYDAAEATALGREPVFVPVEPNDPGNSVMAYGKNGINTANFFRDSGIHALVTYTGGYTGQEDLSGAFTSLQSAFKNLADNGGNNRCPILKVFQSPSVGKATVVQINTPPTGVNYSLHREGNAIQFEQIPGLIGTDNTLGLNRTTTTSPIFYLRMIDNDKAELYLDKNYQTPWDTSTLNNSTNGGSLTWPGNTGDVATGGFILSGYGPEVYFCVLAKPQGSTKGDSPFYPTTDKGKVEVNFSIYWNEIRQ
jgi:hypothetical protein